MRTIKWFILLVVSSGVGTFVDVNILEKIGLNVWLSRGIGCLAAVIIGLLMYRLFFEKKQQNDIAI